MERWTRYKALLKVYLSTFFTTLFFGRKLIDNREKDKQSKTKKFFGKIGAGFSILIIVLVLVSSVISITYSAIEQNYFEQLPYLIVGVCQLSILFLGGNVIISYLYFSEDSQQLLSLPISGSEAFAAKFTVAYLSQLMISAFFLPVMLTFGITATVNGVSIDPSFYVLAVLSILILPAFPTFVVGVLSAPLMLMIKLFRNKERAKTIITVITSGLGMALYFAVIFTTSFGGGDENMISPGTVNLIKNFSNIFIFNHNFCQAMLGNNVVINTLLYFLETFGSLIVAIFLCGVFYKIIMQSMLESTVVSRRKKVKGDPFISKSLKKALFIKDLKMIVKTPMLLFSTLLSIVLIPILTVSMGNTIVGSDNNISPYSMELISLGITYYVVMLLVASSNSVTAVSVSVERSNFFILKTLPITGKQIIDSKLKVSMAFNGITCLAYLVTYLCSMTLPMQPLFAIIMFIVFFVQGMGLSIWEVMRDLERPNFRFNNINELTRNNRNMMKPIFSTMGIGLVGMIIAIACGSALPDNLLYLGYILFFVFVSGLAALMYFLPRSAMNKKVDEIFENTEG